MPREELISLVSRIMSGGDPEEVGEQLMVRLARNLIDPQVSDYIFYSAPPLSAEEVVDKALAYRPIAL
ncbi:hypothetical protein [Streptomyces sp. S4.7]|uniref:hypothetical protein n=1 Tax=Streptomyces sp. S4.7 TaxID=2705439 RepID=UPI0013DCE40F|nr:hypothetical protein [Streptomyces sp. S4.7]